MFDFAWTEIALIGVVALVAIGPKDLPVAIKAVAEMVKKARRMAGEFQTHVDEMVREANLHEVRDQFNDLRRMDIKNKILDAVDGDRTIRSTIADNPMANFDLKPPPPPVPVADSTPPELPAAEGEAMGETLVETRPETVMGDPVDMAAETHPPQPPAFIPPGIAAAGVPAAKALPPAFIPPAVVARSARPMPTFT